jgi:hypothetical protein
MRKFEKSRMNWPLDLKMVSSPLLKSFKLWRPEAVVMPSQLFGHI